MSFANRYSFLCLVIVLTSAAGCSLLKDSTKAKEAVELKKKNYAALYKDVTSNSLQKGASSQQIKELFGEPDDIFASGSQTSSFQIWTYEKIMDPRDESGWQTIQLYFDNNKLVSWKY